MPRFYFHIVVGSVLLDDDGSVFADSKAALQHAKTIARDLRENHGFSSGTIVIEDEGAGHMFEVPVAGLLS